MKQHFSLFIALLCALLVGINCFINQNSTERATDTLASGQIITAPIASTIEQNPSLVSISMSPNTNHQSLDHADFVPPSDDHHIVNITCPVRLYRRDAAGDITEVDWIELESAEATDHFLYDLDPLDPDEAYLVDFDLSSRLENDSLTGDLKIDFSSDLAPNELGMISFRLDEKPTSNVTISYHAEIAFVAHHGLHLEHAFDELGLIEDGHNYRLILTATPPIRPDALELTGIEYHLCSQLASLEVCSVGDPFSSRNLYETDLRSYLYPTQSRFFLGPTGDYPAMSDITEYATALNPWRTRLPADPPTPASSLNPADTAKPG